MNILPTPQRKTLSAVRHITAWFALTLALSNHGLTVSPEATLPDEERQSAPVEPPITAKDRQHWSFRPIQDPKPPRVKNEGQVRNDIDRFILARLEQRDLRLAPQANRETLIRRLYFDLTGLPPTPAQIDAFVRDSAPNAYARVITTLLDSKAYGERWAQHWLDVARFAESDGFEHDKVRQQAWRYRDWVVRALNADMPYDRFVRWQIAGDEFAPDNPDAALGTGFLLAGPDMPDINLVAERRHTVLNEITSSVGAAILGLGVGCAQCHDHKYDPVSQADFYRLRSFFANFALPKKNVSLSHIFKEHGADAPVSHLMIRGDFRRPGSIVTPGYLRVVSGPSDRIRSTPLGNRSTGRRAELARWLTQADHPLTTRVIVNRLWMHHFGKPLVATPNDFGTQGRKPSHPQLLDWLAAELPRQSWSLKRMHRLMLSSATYRQASRGIGAEWQAKLEADPGNELYARSHRRRLDGESIRDAMLHISGRLNRKTGGPGVRPPLPPEVAVTLLKKQWPVTKDASEHYRRSIYLFARRNLRYPMFDVFDRPDALASCAERNVSTTAPQSLTLFNSEFSLSRSRDLAQSIFNQTRPDTGSMITEAYRRVLGRRPSSRELTIGQSFLRSRQTDPVAGLTDYCLALFNLNEFLYID